MSLDIEARFSQYDPLKSYVQVWNVNNSGMSEVDFGAGEGNPTPSEPSSSIPL
jgi:hypothetical protein